MPAHGPDLHSVEAALRSHQTRIERLERGPGHTALALRGYGEVDMTVGTIGSDPSTGYSAVSGIAVYAPATIGDPGVSVDTSGLLVFGAGIFLVETRLSATPSTAALSSDTHEITIAASLGVDSRTFLGTHADGAATVHLVTQEAFGGGSGSVLIKARCTGGTDRTYDVTARMYVTRFTDT